MRVILTGATGFVGEGVLLALLQRTDIEKVLSVSRRPCEINHPKLEEYIVADFMNLPANDPSCRDTMPASFAQARAILVCRARSTTTSHTR